MNNAQINDNFLNLIENSSERLRELNLSLIKDRNFRTSFFDHFIKVVQYPYNTNYTLSKSSMIKFIEIIKDLIKPMSQNFTYLDYFLLLNEDKKFKKDHNKLIILGFKQDSFYMKIPIGFKNTEKIVTFQFVEIIYDNGIWIVDNKKVFNINNYLLHTFMKHYSSYICETLGTTYKYESIDKNYIENIIKEHSKVISLLSY